jgi:hypothetical protein
LGFGLDLSAPALDETIFAGAIGALQAHEQWDAECDAAGKHDKRERMAILMLELK